MKTCKSCGQTIRPPRRRNINAAMAVALITVFKAAGEDTKTWVYVPKLEGAWFRGGDFAKLRHWSLIAPRLAERADGSKRTGWWRVTKRGAMFVRRELEVSRWIWFQNNEPIKYSDETADIVQALGQKFNYKELLV